MIRINSFTQANNVNQHFYSDTADRNVQRTATSLCRVDVRNISTQMIRSKNKFVPDFTNPSKTAAVLITMDFIGTLPHYRTSCCKKSFHYPLLSNLYPLLSS